MPGRRTRSRIVRIAFATSSGASACTETQSAPASQNAATYFVGCGIIRWQSSVAFVALRTLFTSGGPNVMFGTKWPSITSRWRRSAPPSTTLWISCSRCPKSAERIDGAIRTGRVATFAFIAARVAPRPPGGPLPGQQREEIHAARGVAPLVVVPGEHLHEVADHLRRGRVDDRGGGVADDVGGD